MIKSELKVKINDSIMVVNEDIPHYLTLLDLKGNRLIELKGFDACCAYSLLKNRCLNEAYEFLGKLAGPRMTDRNEEFMVYVRYLIKKQIFEVIKPSH